MNANQIHILLIEDDVAYAHFLEKTLLHQGRQQYIIQQVRTLAASLDILSQHLFDVIVLNVLLPDCPDTTKKLKLFHSLAPQSAIVVLTSLESEALRRFALQHGAQDCLFKADLTADAFIRSLHYAIEQRRLSLYFPMTPAVDPEPSPEALSEIIQYTGEGIIVFDSRKVVVLANATAEKIFARPLIGLTPAELSLPADLNNRPINLEIKRADQTTITAEWYVLDFMWHGQATVLVTIQDIADYRYLAQKSTLQTSQIQVLSDISAALRASHSLEATFSFALERIAAMVKITSGLFLLDEGTQELVVMGWYPPNENLVGLRQPIQVGLSAIVMKSERPYFTTNLQQHPGAYTHPSLKQAFNHVSALLVLPILSNDQPAGTLHIGLNEPRSFALDEIRLFTAIAEMLSISFERLTLMETLERRVFERTKALQAANDKLRHLDQLKTKFISDMSHELRTPITALHLYTDLLKRGHTERQERYLAIMEKQITRLTDLAEKILNLSRLDLIDAPTNMQLLDLNQLIEPLYALYQQRAEEQKLKFLFDAGKNLPDVKGAANHLSDAINYLLDNAFNYTQAGFVRLHTTVRNNEIIISVEDSGLGIAASEQSLIFERFYRGNLVVELNIPGTGLGLAIVQEIVQIHHGRIEVQSQADVGSKFIIYLPVTENQEAHT